MRNRAPLTAVSVSLLLSIGCGGGSSSSSSFNQSTATIRLTVTQESTTFTYHYSPGDSVDATREEAHASWALAQLGVTLPQKISYNKYLTRTQMGDITGNYNTNGFAVPEQFAVNTLWSWDNHEPVHVYTALIGRPSDFFNEGIAVAFQTDPVNNDFASRFNGLDVHQAAAQYRRQGQLLPLSAIATTSGFRAVTDDTLSYRESGSFVRYLIDHYGMTAVKTLFKNSTRDDSLSTIQSRFQAAFGDTLAEAESDWLAFLPQ